MQHPCLVLSTLFGLGSVNSCSSSSITEQDSVTPPAVLPPAVLPRVIILQFMICLVEALIIGNKILAWRVFVSLSTEWNVSIPVLRENLALLLHENFIYRVRCFKISHCGPYITFLLWVPCPWRLSPSTHWTPGIETSQFSSLDWFPFNLVLLWFPVNLVLLWFGVIKHGQSILYSMVHDILYLQNIKIQLIKSVLGRLIAIWPKKKKKKKEC